MFGMYDESVLLTATDPRMSLFSSRDPFAEAVTSPLTMQSTSHWSLACASVEYPVISQLKKRTPGCGAPAWSIRTSPSEQAVNTLGPLAGQLMLTSPIEELVKYDLPPRAVHESASQCTLDMRILPMTFLGPTTLMMFLQSENVLSP
jgi:hypothetical protein